MRLRRIIGASITVVSWEDLFQAGLDFEEINTE